MLSHNVFKPKDNDILPYDINMEQKQAHTCWPMDKGVYFQMQQIRTVGLVGLRPAGE